MSARTVAFVGALTQAFPVLLPVLQEHLDDQNGQVLPHLYMADVERWVEAHLTAQRESVAGLVSWLDAQYAQGDPEVRELLEVSFLEMLPRPDQPNFELWELVGPSMAARAAELSLGPRS